MWSTHLRRQLLDAPSAAVAAYEFWVECLERRRLLAGNVSVSISGGNLVVNGEGNDNSVVITTTSPNSYQLMGVNNTTVNFQASDTAYDFHNVTGGVRINLRGGDDQLLLIDPFQGGIGHAVTGDLRIRTGGGNDKVGLDNIDVDGSASIVTGGGNDVVVMTNSNFFDSLTVSTGGGNDVYFSSVADGLIGQVVDAANIRTGGGDDFLIVSGATFRGRTKMIAGGGNDVVALQTSTFESDLIVRGGGGFDKLGDDFNVKLGNSSFASFDAGVVENDVLPLLANQHFLCLNDLFNNYGNGPFLPTP